MDKIKNIKTFILLLFMAISLTYFTVSLYITTAYTSFIVITSIILVPIWLFISKKVIYNYSSKLITFFVSAFNGKKKIKDEEELMLKWLPSLFILVIVCIILFAIYMYYINLEESLLGDNTDYIGFGTKMQSKLLPITLLFSLIMILFLQTKYLYKKEDIPLFISFISSLFSLIIIIILLFIIMSLLMGIFLFF